MLKGLFVNSEKAQCSIYESGLMIKNVLASNQNILLDYVEALNQVPTQKYDFYLINWHHITLPLSASFLKTLPGLKIGIVLEVSPDNCSPYIPQNLFDAYMVIDPTKEKTGNIYPFFRPLEVAESLSEIMYGGQIPVIGGFGFYGNKDKRFEEVIEIYNDTKKECLIRFNFPFSTYIHNSKEITINYANYLRTIAKPNIKLIITHDYMEKQDLIKWCSSHMANAFPYYRNIPGLSAVTDQAISSGRAIIVNGCPTFRHLHKYIPFYPQQTYQELILSTLDGVKQMQKDWNHATFNARFDELLTEKS